LQQAVQQAIFSGGVWQQRSVSNYVPCSLIRNVLSMPLVELNFAKSAKDK
jgi:hypothetical protein